MLKFPQMTEEINYPFQESLAFQNLTETPSYEIQNELLKAELSFLYSTQYFAEQNGESALEHMRQKTYQSTKQNKILDMQIKDEIAHVGLLKTVIDEVGLDSHSTGFADGYTNILRSASSLSEKVFIFQIMTEAVSSAYLNWRLLKIKNTKFNQVDKEIYNDEIRHLKMGKSLLEMCDRDEISSVLTPIRRRELIREMSHMCSQHFFNGMQRILEKQGLSENFKHRSTDLDKMVAKTILTETKSASLVLGEPVT